MAMLTVQSIKVLLDILSHVIVMKNHFSLVGGIVSRLKAELEQKVGFSAVQIDLPAKTNHWLFLPVYAVGPCAHVHPRHIGTNWHPGRQFQPGDQRLTGRERCAFGEGRGTWVEGRVELSHCCSVCCLEKQDQHCRYQPDTSRKIITILMRKKLGS